MPGDDTIVGFNGFENLQVLSCDNSPIWLSRLEKLEFLTLDFNCITCSIPSWLSTFPRLFALYLFHNLILGEFPKELYALPALQSSKALVSNTHLDLPLFYERGNF